jgi:hypothetical protein
MTSGRGTRCQVVEALCHIGFFSFSLMGGMKDEWDMERLIYLVAGYDREPRSGHDIHRSRAVDLLMLHARLLECLNC